MQNDRQRGLNPDLRFTPMLESPGTPPRDRLVTRARAAMGQFASAVVLAAALIGLTMGSAATAPQGGRPRLSAPRFRNDRVLVAFRQGVVLPLQQSTALKHGLEATAGSSKGRFSLLTLSPAARAGGKTVPQVLAALRADPLVRVAEPDFEVRTSALPNDPLFPQLYGLHNTGQDSGSEDADIDAPEAWEATKGSKTVTVAVIDTGVDYRHPDLDFNVLRDAKQRVVGYDFLNDDEDPVDDNGHGTHVSGTIGARGDNGIGVAGVCHTVRLMPVKFLDAQGYGSVSGAIQAIDFAVQHGAHILNNSWGGLGRSTLLLEAIQRARQQGVLVVAAAGNDFANLDQTQFYPASFNADVDNMLVAAATDSRDQIAYFSNFGARSVDVAAPGVDIVSTYLNNTYATLSGTSMGAPHVSGTAALVRSRFPGISLALLKQRVANGADPMLPDYVRHGRLNANRALEPDETPPSAPASLRATHRAESGLQLFWTCPGDDGLAGAASSFELRYSETPISDGSFNAAKRGERLPAPGPSGSEAGFLLARLDPDTDYYVAVRALDNVGNPSGLASGGPFRTLPASADLRLYDGAEAALQFSGEGGWATTNQESFAGSRSYTDSPDGAYGNDVDTSLTQAVPVPLSPGLSELTFRARTDLEYGADILNVEARVDEQGPWRLLGAITGIQGWTLHRFTLGNDPSEGSASQVRVRFRLQTDGSDVRDGVWLDEIRIAAATPFCLWEDRVEGASQFVGEGKWGRTNEESWSPTHSYTDSPGALMGGGVDTALAMTSPVGFDGYIPRLSFRALLDLEPGYDFLSVEVSADEGETWASALLLSEVSGWRRHEVVLGNYTGANLLVRFRVITVYQTFREGVWIDDIQLCGDPLAPYDTPAPPAPESVSATARSATEIDLSWTSPTPNVTAFKIERTQGAGAFGSIGVVPGNLRAYRDAGLRPGTSYTYRLRAVYLGLVSDLSNEGSAQTLGAASLPLAPNRLTAKLLRTGEVRVNWKDNSNNEDRFHLERSVDEEPFRLVEVLPAGVTSYAERGLPIDVTVVYRVRAVNSGGASDASNDASVQMPRSGEIAVSADQILFEGGRVGRSLRQRLVIQNMGDGVLTGQIDPPSTPFRIISGGGRFRLAPGRSRVVVIQFKPTTQGDALDLLYITCSDPLQPTTLVYLLGSAR